METLDRRVLCPGSHPDQRGQPGGEGSSVEIPWDFSPWAPLAAPSAPGLGPLAVSHGSQARWWCPCCRPWALPRPRGTAALPQHVWGWAREAHTRRSPLTLASLPGVKCPGCRRLGSAFPGRGHTGWCSRAEPLRRPPAALSQVRGAGAGTDPKLRVSWDSVLNAERAGRWWIVGSAWSGAPMVDGGPQKALQKPLAGTVRGGPSLHAAVPGVI